MRRRKEDFIIIGLAITLLVVILGIAFVLFSYQKEPTTGETVTPSTTQKQPSSAEPTEARSKSVYDSKAQDKLLNKIENRTPLQQSDSVAKATILASLPTGEQSGILYTTNSIVIDYTASADLFQVEIMTKDIAQAKAEATIWFQAKGMSQEAICNLPVMFYLNYDVMQELRGTNIRFNPLAEGC